MKSTVKNISDYHKRIVLFLNVVLYLVCFYDTILWLHYKFNFQDSYYSHGYLIPFVTLYLIITKKNELLDVIPCRNKIGIVILTSAILMRYVSLIADINFISAFAMWIYLIGSILFLFGAKVLNIIKFPIFFLIFMIPLPNNFINIVAIPSKKIATYIGLKIVGLFSIPFYQEGFRITLENAVMSVGKPCNGMRTLITFLALGCLCLYKVEAKIWKWLIILLTIYPIAIILNGVRVAVLIIMTHYLGIEYTRPESIYHTATGFIVFVIGMAILFILVKIINTNTADKKL